ncbi:MAG: transporter substrate-binding domain-containing protein [Desulfobacterales bacterium]|nr:transporter substrate-binding domain-containing protein [Desulfobacterales bacterium]
MTQKLILIFILLATTGNMVYADQAGLKENDPLVIAVSKWYAPFTMLNADAKPTGLLIDIWRLWAEKTGRKIKFRTTDWNETVLGLKNGEADIHSGLFRSKDRSEWMIFSQPFYETESAIFYHTKYGEITGTEALAGQKTGTIRGTYQADYLQKHYPELELVFFDKDKEMITAAAGGHIRAFIEEVIPVKNYAIRLGMQGELKNLKQPRYSKKIFAAVLKNRKELLELIDNGLDKITNKEIYEIESRWIPDPDDRYYTTHAAGIRLTAAEETWLLNNKKIHAGVGIAWPPFQYMESGEFKGIASDYIRILNDRLGLQMKVVKGISWKEAVARAKNREIDVFVCATETPERREYMNFTPPYLSSPLVIISKKDAPFIGGMEDLHGRKVSFVKTLSDYSILINKYPGIVPHFVKKPLDRLEAVSLGKADATIENLAVASYLILKKNLANLKVAAPTSLKNTDLSFAARNDWPLLVSILKKGLDSISQDEHNEIRQKWIAVRYEHGITKAHLLKLALQISGAAALVLALVFIWNIQILRREERFRGLTEYGTDITQAFGQDGTIVYQSPSHKTILGYDDNELMGKSAFRLFHEQDAEKLNSVLKALLSGQGVQSLVHRIRRKDGQYRYFESNCINLLANKALRAIVINARDITDRKQAQEELQQAYRDLEIKASELEEVNRELSQYTYVVSHDLRAPMRAIHNYSDFLREDLEETLDGDQKEYLDGLCRAVTEANALIGDLLELSRIGRQSLSCEPVEPGAFLRELLKSLSLPQDVRTVMAENWPVIEVEPVLLRQVFQNLITNAVKFNNSSEKIVELGCQSAEQGDCELFVRDNGIGIEPRFYQQIFRVFERLHTKEEYDGTGIGLAIVKKALGKMNCSVRVESEPGKGSTFFVRVPKKITGV